MCNQVCLLLLQAAPVLESLQKKHKQEHGRLVSVTAAPEKARRQADLAMADLAAAQQLLVAADTKHMEVEANLRGVIEHLRQRQVRPKTTFSSHPVAAASLLTSTQCVATVVCCTCTLFASCSKG